MKNMHNC